MSDVAMHEIDAQRAESAKVIGGIFKDLVNPSLRAEERLARIEEQLTRIEARLSVAAVLTDAKLDSILEKLACASTSPQSSHKPKRY